MQNAINVIKSAIKTGTARAFRRQVEPLFINAIMVLNIEPHNSVTPRNADIFRSLKDMSIEEVASKFGISINRVKAIKNEVTRASISAYKEYLNYIHDYHDYQVDYFSFSKIGNELKVEVCNVINFDSENSSATKNDLQEILDILIDLEHQQGKIYQD